MVYDLSENMHSKQHTQLFYPGAKIYIQHSGCVTFMWRCKFQHPSFNAGASFATPLLILTSLLQQLSLDGTPDTCSSCVSHKFRVLWVSYIDRLDCSLYRSGRSAGGSQPQVPVSIDNGSGRVLAFRDLACSLYRVQRYCRCRSLMPFRLPNLA